MTLSNDNIDTRTPRPARKAVARKLNRVGSKSPQIASATVDTIGQRMTARRMQLKLTQADVARQVPFQSKSGRRKGTERPLSRAAYAMFEIDQAQPDLKKIEAIAKALGISPGWLAFGEKSAVASEEPAVVAGNDDEVEVTRWVIPKCVGAREVDLPANDKHSITITIRR